MRSTWGTLVTRLAPLVTEAAVRTFGGSDFRPSELYTLPEPVTVYLRWPERNLEALVPLVRLVWDTLLGELIEWWAAAMPAERAKASPVLCLVDEAARTPIPAIPEYMAPVAGYGISVWVAVQSLAQLETSYGPGRAATIRDSADAHVYYAGVTLRRPKRCHGPDAGARPQQQPQPGQRIDADAELVGRLLRARAGAAATPRGAAARR